MPQNSLIEALRAQGPTEQFSCPTCGAGIERMVHPHNGEPWCIGTKRDPHRRAKMEPVK